MLFVKIVNSKYVVFVVIQFIKKKTRPGSTVFNVAFYDDFRVASQGTKHLLSAVSPMAEK